MTDSAAPVTLISGYLGAGKTTWLNTRIRAGLPADSLVLINDFGAVNIDADLIEYRNDRLLALSNGCICCSLSDSLAAQLARVGRWPTPPAALFIETSGVAEPARIVDLVTVAKRFRMAQTLCLVDAASIVATLADNRVATLVRAQIAGAGRLILNREERLEASARDELIRRLRGINPAAVIETGGALAPAADAPPPVALRFTPAAATPAWQRFAVSFPGPVSRPALEALLGHYAGVLARAKGVLLDADGRSLVFQWSGGRAAWVPASKAAGSGQLVGIGFAGPEWSALIAALEKLAG